LSEKEDHIELEPEMSRQGVFLFFCSPAFSCQISGVDNDEIEGIR